jgi:deoxyribonuclease-1
VVPPSRPLDFGDAKRALRGFYDRGDAHETLYAGCHFVRWKVAWESCCVQPRHASRARLEWEHVVPAALLGKRDVAWREGDPACRDRRGRPYHGRRCARLASPRFRAVEGDMHNLFPTLGELNEARGHAPMGLVAGEPRRFGACDFEVEGGVVEPRAAARGEVARAYLYMADAYPDLELLGPGERERFMAWSAADPADAAERARSAFIAGVQGNDNPYIR